MRAREARFIISAAKPDGFPAPSVPEIAFAGRSNVGKSSLINALTGHDSLARTSNTPGRTRLVNWFEVLPPKGKLLAFVDLPGYGYAKVPKQMRAEWRPLIEAYLGDRSVLRAVVVLIDARRGAEVEERELIEWLLANEVPVIPVLTKVDKLSKSKRKPAGAALVRELGLPGQPVLFSAQSGEGLAELWRAILAAAY